MGVGDDEEGERPGVDGVGVAVVVPDVPMGRRPVTIVNGTGARDEGPTRLRACETGSTVRWVTGVGTVGPSGVRPGRV